MTEDTQAEQRQALQHLLDAGVLSAAEFDTAMARLPLVSGTPVFDQPAPPLPDPATSTDAFPPSPAPHGSPFPVGGPPQATAPGSALERPPVDRRPQGAAAPEVTWQRAHPSPPQQPEPAPPQGASPDQPPPQGAWPYQPPPQGAWPAQASTTRPAPPGPAHVNPMDEVRVPPQLVAAGSRVATVSRRLVGGDDAHLWIAAATAAGLISVVQTVLVVLTAGGTLDEVVTNPIRAVVTVFAVATPAALHAAVRQGVADGLLTDAAATSTNLPPTMLTVLLLGVFGLLARRHWRRHPPIGLRAAGLEVVRAVVALTGVALLMALLTTIAGYLFISDGPQVRAGLWSTAWWAAVFGTAAAVTAIAPVRRPTGPDDGTASGLIARPMAREGVAALRGAVTGTVGLLALALVLIVALGMRELAIAGGEGVVGGLTGTILLLPTALVVVAGMTLAVPVVVRVGGPFPALGTGEPVASVGLRGIEGLIGPATSVPAWFWLIMLAAVAVLVLAGAGATWRAAAEGVKATRAGIAIGPMMALLWVPLGLVAAGSVRFEDGAGDLLLVLRAIGLRGLGGAADGGLRVGLASGLLFATLLVTGAAAGWLGSLLAKRLWGRAPTWVVHLLGGRPRPATSADAASAPPPSSLFSDTPPPPSSGPPHPW